MKKYTIKPLVWVHTKRDDYESWSAETGILGGLSVNRRDDDGTGFSSWEFSWCVDEYYDEGSECVDDADAGKALAEAWYLERLTVALNEVPPAGGNEG